MGNLKIAVVVGSIRRDSINRMLARAAIKLAPENLDCALIRIDDLPVYNQDLDPAPPEPVVRLKAQIAAAAGVLFVTPEHNRSLPAALKNALDWVSRPYGKNLWAGRPAGIMGASPGAIGTACAQQHLRNVLAYLDVPTLGQPEMFISFSQGLVDGDDTITNESTRKFLRGFMERYAGFVTRYS